MTVKAIISPQFIFPSPPPPGPPSEEEVPEVFFLSIISLIFGKAAIPPIINTLNEHALLIEPPPEAPTPVFVCFTLCVCSFTAFVTALTS